MLVVRGEDGSLRAFFNVCRHRAAPVLHRAVRHGDEAALPLPRLDLRPRRPAPRHAGVRRRRGLPQGGQRPRAGRWPSRTGGRSSGCISTSRANPLERIPRSAARRGSSRARRSTGWRGTPAQSYDLACNWKVFVDNYLDGGYHVNTVHPGLAGVLDYREYTTMPDGNTALQISPLKPGEGDAGRTRTGDLAAYWWVFPNFMLNLYEGVMDTNLVLPLGPDRCRVIFDFYFAARTDEDFRRESIAVADQVQVEDVGICEEVQRGLNSRVVHDRPLQREARERRVSLPPDVGAARCRSGRINPVSREASAERGAPRSADASRLTGLEEIGGSRFRGVVSVGADVRAGRVRLVGAGAALLRRLRSRASRRGRSSRTASLVAADVLVLTAVDRRLGRPRSACSAIARLVLTLLLASSLLAVNWLLYIYATVTDRVTEASLGYYMMPLVNAFLATIFLEREAAAGALPGAGTGRGRRRDPVRRGRGLHLDRGRAAGHVRLLRAGPQDGAGGEHSPG